MAVTLDWLAINQVVYPIQCPGLIETLTDNHRELSL
jgi:hypothetical protein